MKKIALALTAVAAFAGSALAADLPARTYTKAPVAAAPVTSWTGCYVGAGGGGAMTNNDHMDIDTFGFFTRVPGSAFGPNITTGARGWFGTVQGGCDYQFNNWVVGAFADYDFMDVSGDLSTFGNLNPAFYGTQKQDQQWAIGGRVGYLVFPQLLTYVSGGYTQAHWKDTALSTFFPGGPVGLQLNGTTKGGWFIGAGDEYSLAHWLPGLFWKTEYRYSEFDSANANVVALPSGVPGYSLNEKFREQSVRTELVYRFNWGGGPLVAKY